LVREALRHATDRVTEGDLSGYALRRLRVERARYESALLAATLATRAARRRLAGFLVPESDSVIAPAGFPAGDPPDVTVDALGGLGAGVPALAAARAALNAARADEQAVSRGRVPALTATGGYKTQSDGLDGVFLGFTLPLPLFDRRGAAAAEATAASAAAEARLALARRLVETDLRLAFETYQAARDRSRLVADELLAEPEALLRIARVAYAEGEMSLVELLDAVEAFRAARTELVEVRRDLWISFFDFERAAGGLPSEPEGGR
jgi:cobalt-zinc-cadmium efflux system outer membrane protein